MLRESFNFLLLLLTTILTGMSLPASFFKKISPVDFFPVQTKTFLNLKKHLSFSLGSVLTSSLAVSFGKLTVRVRKSLNRIVHLARKTLVLTCHIFESFAAPGFCLVLVPRVNDPSRHPATALFLSRQADGII